MPNFAHSHVNFLLIVFFDNFALRGIQIDMGHVSVILNTFQLISRPTVCWDLIWRIVGLFYSVGHFTRTIRFICSRFAWVPNLRNLRGTDRIILHCCFGQTFCCFLLGLGEKRGEFQRQSEDQHFRHFPSSTVHFMSFLSNELLALRKFTQIYGSCFAPTQLFTSFKVALSITFGHIAGRTNLTAWTSAYRTWAVNCTLFCAARLHKCLTGPKVPKSTGKYGRRKSVSAQQFCPYSRFSRRTNASGL